MTATITVFKAALSKLHQVIRQYKIKVEGINDYPLTIHNFCDVNDKVKQVLHDHNSNNRNIMLDKISLNVVKSTYSKSDISRLMITQYNKTGSDNVTVANNAINTILEMLMGHMLLFRGDNKRELEISDASFADIETTFGTMPILQFGVVKEKSMKGDSPVRVAGVTRSKSQELCLVSAFALSLWFRFDLEAGPFKNKMHAFPNFLDKKDWYKVKVLYNKSTDGRKSISSQHELRIASECIEELGFPINKKTHLGRKNQSNLADAGNVSVNQIEKAGHWASGVLNNHYLIGLPFEFIHHSAYFKKDEKYFLYRSRFEPPKELSLMIFPWLEDIEAKYNEIEQPLDRKLSDKTAGQFFKMLRSFRNVILQDLVYLKDLAPESAFAKHEICSKPSFMEFEKEIKKGNEASKFKEVLNDPDSVIEAITPEISHKINKMMESQIEIAEEQRNFYENELRKLNDRISRENRELKENMAQIREHMKNQNEKIDKLIHLSLTSGNQSLSGDRTSGRKDRPDGRSVKRQRVELSGEESVVTVDKQARNGV